MWCVPGLTDRGYSWEPSLGGFGTGTVSCAGIQDRFGDQWDVVCAWSCRVAERGLRCGSDCGFAMFHDVRVHWSGLGRLYR